MNTRKTKIVCTIGPASSGREAIRSLIKGGMDVARLNFSHGDHVTYKKIAKLIREESGNLKKAVAILQDLQGIKIRVGLVSNGSVELKKGAEIFLHSGKEVSRNKHIFISYPALRKDMRIGDRILFDDGLIQANVTGKTRDGLRAKIIDGGVLRDKKGVNLPRVKTTLPSFTDKDKKDLSFGLTIGVDYAALSFVRSASDVRVVKEWLKKRRASLPLIAKIEKPEALDDIDGILDEADGIMIARGDLGVEVSPEEVPVIQKMLISKANEKGKLVITATQMLESMTEHSKPTRAEATDVANAVIDGSDALMLSAETATGKYALNSVKMMDRIIRYTGSKSLGKRDYYGFASLFSDFSGAVAEAACTAAEDIRAKAIVAFTQSGFTARLVSKFRPEIAIIGVTPHNNIKRSMSLYRGVTPMLISHVSDTDDMIQKVGKLLIASRTAKRGDNIVITAGSPLLKRGTTNLIKLHKIS
ncbi:MAG: pyruvate kinase [Thermodesulfovibrionales bacterium]|nr:pyruvate kinase [Thermodesulfovibrionales bacterium]